MEKPIKNAVKHHLCELLKLQTIPAEKFDQEKELIELLLAVASDIIICMDGGIKACDALNQLADSIGVSNETLNKAEQRIDALQEILTTNSESLLTLVEELKMLRQENIDLHVQLNSAKKTA